MNPSKFSLSAEVLDEMLAKHAASKSSGFESSLTGASAGTSLNDQAEQKLEEIFVNLSRPLKKMKLAYLGNV